MIADAEAAEAAATPTSTTPSPASSSSSSSLATEADDAAVIFMTNGRGGGGSHIRSVQSSSNGNSFRGAKASSSTPSPLPEGCATSLTADRGASFHRQMWLCFSRSLLQQYRAAATYGLEVGVAGVSGGIMGLAASQLPELYNGVLVPPYTLISPAPLEPIVPSVGMYIALAVGLAGSPAGVLAFGEEKDVFYR